MTYTPNLYRQPIPFLKAFALVMILLSIGCTIGSRGRIFVADTQTVALENEIAISVGDIVARHGYEVYWGVTKYQQGAPCTMERGCVWIYNHYTSVASVSKTTNGHIKIEVQTNDHIHDERVKRVIEEVSQILISRFGNQKVTVELVY